MSLQAVLAVLGVVAVFATTTCRAQESDVVVGNSTAECADSLIKWCSAATFSNSSVSMVSSEFKSPSGYFRALCVSDSDGVNCTRNGQPWLSCSPPDGALTYKNKPLTAGDQGAADDQICDTADRAFNDMDVQSLTNQANITQDVQRELEKGLEGFFQQMALMREQIERINKYLYGGFGGRPGFWGGLGEAYVPVNPGGGLEMER